jgi:superfamily II DNA helicase RecQ
MIIRMPTGSGKSLVYQLPAFIEKGELVTVVFTPLLSLVQDQIKNINALQPEMASVITQEMMEGDKPTPLIYLTYHKYFDGSIYSNFIFKLVADNKIGRIVFDECQTLTLWSHFTPFKQFLPLIRTEAFPLLFLTGSASPAIIRDLSNMFNLPMPTLYYQKYARKNIEYTLSAKKNV